MEQKSAENAKKQCNTFNRHPQEASHRRAEKEENAKRSSVSGSWDNLLGLAAAAVTK